MFEGVPVFTNIVDVVDILIVAAVLYWLMLLLKGTRAERMLWGLAVVVVVYFASQGLGLFTLQWILSNFLGSIVIIVIILFQQEIRRALAQMGRAFSSHETMSSTESLDEVSRAVSAMSADRVGGIIVIERGMDMKDLIDTGIELDAKVSRELLLAIFNPHSPMHDGAVLVHGNRVLKAGCILPLTEKELTKSIGTRHRAALGLSEQTDAAVVVVSEKTGEVSLVIEEKLELGLDPALLPARLKAALAPEDKPASSFFPWKAGR
ncbi:MAG: diadenylate cyclase CdaA [Thermodesulfobacteriota bacterium]